jgi:hypothetical protein
MRKHAWPLSIVVLLLCAQPGAVRAQQRGLRDGETARETDAAFPGAGPVDAVGTETLWCVRIVDAVDRRPIAGALVQVPWHPATGVPDAELHYQCAGRADWDGWVRLPWSAVEGYRDYVFADAPGYAASEKCEPGLSECELQRGTDVPVLVVDYTGRTVPGARIELILGCGHVPGQRTAVADASGRATLPSVLPSRHEDFFVTAPGCHLGAYRLRRTWRPGDPPVEIDVVPGIDVVGRVLDAAAQPVAGVAVGAREKARPWARTGLDGRFRLVGVARWQEIAFEPPPQLGYAAGTFVAPPPGVERTLVLGQVVTGAPVEVRVHSERGDPATDVRVTLVRDGDGLTSTSNTGDDGRAQLSVAPGHYRVLADGELGTWSRAEGIVNVGAGAPTAVDLTVALNPTVHVDASRIGHMTLGITTADAFRQLDPGAVNGTYVPVPSGERATFRISTWEEGELLVKFVEIPAPGSTLVLEGPPVTRLKAHCVGPDGQPMSANLEVRREQKTWFSNDDDQDEGTAEATAETRLVGTVNWIAQPHDAKFAPILGVAKLSGNSDVDLGTIAFRKSSEPDLRLALPSELEGWGASVGVSMVRANAFFLSRVDAEGTVPFGLSKVGEGDRLVVRSPAPGMVPFSFRVPGPPPWTVQWPTGSLRIALTSERGRSVARAVAIIDGVVVNEAFATGGPLDLRGVSAGDHTLVLAERDHLAKVLQFRCRDGEHRDIEVVLTPREQ